MKNIFSIIGFVTIVLFGWSIFSHAEEMTWHELVIDLKRGLSDAEDSKKGYSAILQDAQRLEDAAKLVCLDKDKIFEDLKRSNPKKTTSLSEAGKESESTSGGDALGVGGDPFEEKLLRAEIASKEERHICDSRTKEREEAYSDYLRASTSVDDYQKALTEAKKAIKKDEEPQDPLGRVGAKKKGDFSSRDSKQKADFRFWKSVRDNLNKIGPPKK